MKWPLILIVLASAVLFSSMASAISTSGLVAYWSLDNNTATIEDIHTGTYNLTKQGSPAWEEAAFNYGGFNLSQTNSLISPYFTNKLNTTTSFCLAKWSKYASALSSASYEWDFLFKNAAGKYGLSSLTPATSYGINLMVATNDGSFHNTASWTPTKTSWHYFVWCRDNSASRMIVWEDGVVKLNATPTWDTPTAPFLLEMNDNAGATGMDGPHGWDEVSLWNTRLNQQDVDDLYNGGSGCCYDCLFPSGGAPSPPTWANPTATDGVANNTQVYLNASCDAGLNYYLYFDGSNPPTTAVLSNSSTGFWTTNVTAGGTYYYSAACYNVTSGLYSSNTTPRSWVYDIQAPAINLKADNEFNDINRSVLLQFDDWLNLSMNFTDDHELYAWNITVNASNGTGMYSAQNSSLSGTVWNMTRNVNVSSWVAGWYDVQVWVSDSHTANKIPDYQVTKKKSSIAFKPGNDNNIRVETLEASTITAQKLEDRYTFRMVFDDGQQKTRVFDVKTDKCPLDYRAHSGFKAHFVSFCGGREAGNWIDFEGAGGQASVVKIDDFHYRVTIQNVPSDVTFQSIGGLNTYTRSWRWYRGTYTTTAERATDGDPFSVAINLTTDPTFTLNASFVWNATSYNVTTDNGSGWRSFTVDFTNESQGTYWYTWTVNVTQDDGNESQLYINLTHTVEDWYLDNCSAATNRTIRWDLYNEDVPSASLNGTAELFMTYYPVSSNNTKSLNVSYKKATFFEVCLSPASLNFTADIYLQYKVDGAFTHRFYVQAGEYNSTRTDYKIYNFVNQTGKSDMKITTRLEDDYSYFERVLVYLQRFYVSQGVWRTVQMDRSGDYGLVFFNVIEENTDYRLLYYDSDNNLLHQTTSMKFICTAGVCDLTQLLGDYEATTTSTEVSAGLTYNNATSVISVAWAGPPLESHSVAFKAVKETVTGPLTLCSSTQTGASGSFTCNATGSNGQVYVTAEVDGDSYALAEWVDTRNQKLSQQMSGAEASLWSFGIASTIVMIGVFSPVGAIIGLIMGLIALFFLGILGPLTITALILSVVVGIAISLKVKT